MGSDPTIDPTVDPTIDPTRDPTSDPTLEPTTDPTIEPTDDPTSDPTIDPTIDPTTDPTAAPSFSPTESPTLSPVTDAVVNDIVPTAPVLIENESDNQDVSELGTSSNAGITNSLQQMFGEMWYVTLGAIGFILLLCCYCGIKKKRESDEKKNYMKNKK